MTSTTATPETPGAHGADPDGRPAIREGATGSAALVVAPKHLASAFAEESGEAYPRVLATPGLVGRLGCGCAAVKAAQASSRPAKSAAPISRTFAPLTRTLDRPG